MLMHSIDKSKISFCKSSNQAMDDTLHYCNNSLRSALCWHLLGRNYKCLRFLSFAIFSSRIYRAWNSGNDWTLAIIRCKWWSQRHPSLVSVVITMLFLCTEIYIFADLTNERQLRMMRVNQDNPVKYYLFSKIASDTTPANFFQSARSVLGTS